VPLRYWEGNPYLQDRLGKCVECYATYWEAQARLAEEEGIPIVDVLTLFHGPERDQDPYELGYFFDSDPHHVNFEGAKAIAKLYQSIGYEYWLPTANDIENAE
jgi:lysophospholipase L1-like esterase